MIDNKSMRQILSYMGFDNHYLKDIPTDMRKGSAESWQARQQISRTNPAKKCIWIYTLNDKGIPMDMGRELSEFILDEYS